MKLLPLIQINYSVVEQRRQIKSFELDGFNDSKAFLVMTVSTVSTVSSIRMLGGSYFMDNCVETVHFIRFVLDYTCCSVGFLERIGAFYLIAVPLFVLLLFVTGVRIVDGVVEIVFRIGLKKEKGKRFELRLLPLTIWFFYLRSNLFRCLLRILRHIRLRNLHRNHLRDHHL